MQRDFSKYAELTIYYMESQCINLLAKRRLNRIRSQTPLKTFCAKQFYFQVALSAT